MLATLAGAALAGEPPATVPMEAQVAELLHSHRRERLESLCRQLLIEIDPEPKRADLAETPRRWAAWWLEFIEHQPGTTDTAFETVQTDQMVIVSGIRVWSLCEHHLLPFWCDVAVGYLTRGHLIGLSKLARIAHQYAHRLQVQERLVEDIAAHVEKVTRSSDVGVIASGEHLCMTMRGIRTPALMTSSALHGTFRSDARVRAEFLELARRK